MDPLSFAASIIAVATLAAKTAKELSHLCRAIRDAPVEVHALNNEVADLQGILHAIQAVADTEDQGDGAPDGALPNLEGDAVKSPGAMITVHLDRAKEKLSALSQLIQKCLVKANSFHFHKTWLKERSRARALQRELLNIKRNLQTALLLMNSSRSARIELIVQEVLLGQQHLSDDLIQSFQATSVQHYPLSGQVSAVVPKLSLDAEDESVSIPSGSTPQHPSTSMKADVVEIRTSCAGSRSPSCNKWCSCVCHKQNRLKFATPLTYVLGSLFIGYSGLPVSTPPCNERSCSRRAIPALEFSYYFPRWFLARSILMSLRIIPLVGPELNLRMPRLIRWTTKEATLFHAARSGNLGMVQSMFDAGTVTPFDVTLSSGESALFMAASSGQFKTCKFLLDAGADAQLANKYQIKPIECAWQWILNGRLDAATASAVRTMFDEGSFLETRQFTVIHKIVLGLLPFKDLEAELRASTSTVNDVDVRGRSALSWAVERADNNAARLLLTYGAETQNPDNEGAYPLHYAATSKNPDLIQTLLEHGAEVNCRTAFGHTPLQQTSWVRDDDKFLRPLLAAGADIDAGDDEGETALMYAARNERLGIAAYLLQNGADINAHTIWGLTALDLCVRYNCHQMLNFLLQRGADYTSKDIHSQTIVHQAAKDGDVRTVATLIDAGVMGVAGVPLDSRDAAEKTAWEYLSDRGDVEIAKLFNAAAQP